jgi:phospholipid transport system transporter-binding protein
MLVLPTKLTHDEAPACMRMLQQGLQGPDRFVSTVVDATALAQFDSSALAVLLECRREASALGRGSRSRACRRACASWPRCTESQAFCPPRPEKVTAP